MHAHLTALVAFLPGEPVTNDRIDAYLGAADRISARTRKLILASNGIQTRHYAIDPTTGEPTYTNAQLAAEAVRRLCATRGLEPVDLGCLCCGTSSPDQLMPGHASMVHGELGGGPCEVVSTAGICLTGVTALKYAAMAVDQGLTANAAVTGSELASSFMRSDFFAQTGSRCADTASESATTHPAFSFEENFLRWMLSDGAGAVLVEREATAALSLRIDWIEIVSQAHRLPACMYAGAVQNENGGLTGWRQLARQGLAQAAGVFTVKQDARLLNREVLPVLVGESLPPIIAKHDLRADQIDWFLPHYSSGFFRQPLAQQLAAIGFAIPEDRWFTNLASRGNTGSASFFIMLEELVGSGRVQKGQRLLAMVPESGRFSVGYLLLTAV
jgi:3-oxoacyl-[acyl-carrier-protein] synthase-3